MSFNHKTIEELHDLLVAKEISATELTKQHLKTSSLVRRLSGRLSLFQKKLLLNKLRQLMPKVLMLTTSCQVFH